MLRVSLTVAICGLPLFAGYEVVVEIPGASETPHFHSAHHPATLTCLVSLNTSLHTSQDMHVTWMRGDVVLQNTSQHMVSEMSQVNANGSYGVNTTHFESTLMMHAMETTDDGMYSCLAGVVSSSSGQPLSPLASSSVVMAVVGKAVDVTFVWLCVKPPGSLESDMRVTGFL